MLTTFVWQTTYLVATQHCPMELQHIISSYQLASESSTSYSESVNDPAALAAGLDYFWLKGSFVFNLSHTRQAGFNALIYLTEAHGNCTAFKINLLFIK